MNKSRDKWRKLHFFSAPHFCFWHDPVVSASFITAEEQVNCRDQQKVRWKKWEKSRESKRGGRTVESISQYYPSLWAFPGWHTICGGCSILNLYHTNTNKPWAHCLLFIICVCVCVHACVCASMCAGNPRATEAKDKIASVHQLICVYVWVYVC